MVYYFTVSNTLQKTNLKKQTIIRSETDVRRIFIIVSFVNIHHFRSR